MLSEKWWRRLWTAARVITVLVAVIYMISLSDRIDSIQSDIDSIQNDVSQNQSDVSGIDDGSCGNSRICP
jgi:cell division protein FtsL